MKKFSFALCGLAAALFTALLLAGCGRAAQPEYVCYEDDYLRYEIPAGWEMDEESSVPAAMATLFSPAPASPGTPSNVVVQINSLKNSVPDSVDFSSEERMQSFLRFVQSSVRFEMTDAEITGYECGRLYVYKISYSVDTGTAAALQTAYYPQKLPYTVSVFATDFSDGTEPGVQEAAEHILETLTVKQ